MPCSAFWFLRLPDASFDARLLLILHRWYPDPSLWNLWLHEPLNFPPSHLPPLMPCSTSLILTTSRYLFWCLSFADLKPLIPWSISLKPLTACTHFIRLIPLAFHLFDSYDYPIPRLVPVFHWSYPLIPCSIILIPPFSTSVKPLMSCHGFWYRWIVWTGYDALMI